MEAKSKIQYFWLTKGDLIDEWIRLRFHTLAVTVLTYFNLIILGGSALFNWLGIGFNFFIFPYLPLSELEWNGFLVLLNLPIITWFYSTITFPIKKGHKIQVDWAQTDKGRFKSFLFNLIPLILMLWMAAAKYIQQHYERPLEKIRVSPDEFSFLMSKSLDPLILTLYALPVLITSFLAVMAYRHYIMNNDILKPQFYSWEFKPITRFNHNLEYGKCDVIVGWNKETKKPIVLKENSRFLHELITGATGSGKTSTTILLRISQDLVRIAKGEKMGIVLLEPKGDAVDDVLKLAKELGVPDEKIYVVDPTKTGSTKFNPFFGPLESAAESFRGTLDALTGDQDDFFKGQQGETAALFTMLAKLYYRNLTNVTHIQRMYTDPRYLADITESLRKEIDKKKGEPGLTNEDAKVLDQYERIIRYFEDEVLDYKTYRDKENILPLLFPEGHRYAGRQIVENKKDKYVTGAKKYLNEISMNALLSDLMVANDTEKVLNMDEFLASGGVLLVNTALGELEELSLMLGQFFIRQFQSAVFRRPKDNRCPVFLNIDEFPLYINQAFERFLTLGRSYKVGSLIAIQSLGQLDSVVPGYQKTILANASSKTVFGRGAVDDNKVFSETFGEEEFLEESQNESSTPITVEQQSWGLRLNTQKTLKPRFTPTNISELPFKHMIVQLVEDNGDLGKAQIAYGKFVSETRFLKKYFKLGKLNFKSEKEEEFDISIAEQLYQQDSLVPASPSTTISNSEAVQDSLEVNTPVETESSDEVEQLTQNSPEEFGYDSFITDLKELTSQETDSVIIDFIGESQLSIPLPEETKVEKKHTDEKKTRKPVEDDEDKHIQTDIYSLDYEEPSNHSIPDDDVMEFLDKEIKAVQAVVQPFLEAANEIAVGDEKDLLDMSTDTPKATQTSSNEIAQARGVTIIDDEEMDDI